MIRATLAVGILCISTLAVAAPSAAPSATEIANRNVAARGGLQAWRAIQGITMQGKLGAGGNQRARLPEPVPGKQAAVLPTDPRPAEEVKLPFVLELQRPLKMRFEIKFRQQTAVQVFDGTKGWKVRPYLNRQDVEPFTADELQKASAQSELDGPLVDYAAKGTTVSLDGVEKVDDRSTYKLKLTLKNGQVTHVWIDAQTFLEAKVEGQPRHLDGLDHPVEIFYKDYREVGGVKIPFLLETQVLPAPGSGSRVKALPVPVEKIEIDKVMLNPKLEASQFIKPELMVAKATPAK